MQRRDWTDIIGGIALILFGIWFHFHARADYSLGDLRRMGPGFFPAVLGILVAILGALTIIPALFRPGELPVPKIRALVAIIAGGLAFAWAIEPLGLIPATVLLIAIVTQAEPAPPVLRTAILAVSLSAMAVLVFTVGLGIPIPAVRWSTFGWGY
ncbi:tripartite tricarboxylate transporter TctB family protein [Roseomonas stagni]|uniref:Tripartite tricarboxylate transporter TctB family protein n=1 Tax=Falsiroseomonas algicola TaxID=2716930 RepID=A0A6M1LKF5_9PROT|nr:tripartite tricarboxylate transporter TctB family protein [Falsiroseomonas algicola]NGM20677.1 tripartite tricarboxylate transporter TctB family protein [Falsiroseomonas algicola]